MKLRNFIIGTGLCLLTACGAGDNPGGNPGGSGFPSSDNTTINSFVLTGTADNGNGPALIDAAMNNGIFSIAWDVSSSNPYRVDFYLSDDAVLDEGNDVDLGGFNCGSMVFNALCSNTGTMDCQYQLDNNSNYTVFCGPQSAVNGPKRINNFLDTLPKNAYFIFQACNGLFTDCKSRSVAVVFP